MALRSERPSAVQRPADACSPIIRHDRKGLQEIIDDFNDHDTDGNQYMDIYELEAALREWEFPSSMQVRQMLMKFCGKL